MRRTFMLISAAVLSMIVGVQTAMAQKVTLYMAGNQTFECDITRLDSIVFSEGQTIPAEEIVVTVDANGNADGGHLFTKIDDNKFYIDDIKYTAESGALIVTGYDKAYFKGAANIISKLIYNGRTLDVVGIASNAFEKCGVLTSVTIPNSVTSIGNQAFVSCTSLTSVTIPNSVTSIGYYAFRDCSSLTSITIGSGVTSIGFCAFNGCSSLTSVTIPNSVTSIDSYAFNDCSSLTSITIPNSVTSIGSYAFDGCSSLTSVTIPNSVTSIGYNAFSNCSSLTSIVVESGNTVYDSRNGCNAIIKTATNTLIGGCKNTIIPNSVTSIGSSAFHGCSGLTSITIPNSVTSIGDYAFAYCTSLTSLTIGSGVTSIGDHAFSYCQSLTDVYCYAENLPSTDSYAFRDSPISSATLHVPTGSVNSYKSQYPWSSFGRIVAIE